MSRDTPPLVRQIADQAFSRASGAPLRHGNTVRLLKDAHENYPAWLAAIAAARQTIHFEMYIIHEDAQGHLFADALIAKARRGVRVRLLYDWMGGFGKTSRGFWRRLRTGGVEVRCYNPPRFESPLGWLSRDHRKLLSVDRSVAFVTGLCVGQAWVGNPRRGIAPWRDTGVELRGPAVADCEAAFAEAWATAGPPFPSDDPPAVAPVSTEDDVTVRVVASVPNTAGLFRLDQLVDGARAQDAVAHRRVLRRHGSLHPGAARGSERWGGRPPARARGVRHSGDSSLLACRVPAAARGGRACVRVERPDGAREDRSRRHRWARVGSTNLNIASGSATASSMSSSRTNYLASGWRRCISTMLPMRPRSCSIPGIVCARRRAAVPPCETAQRRRQRRPGNRGRRAHRSRRRCGNQQSPRPRAGRIPYRHDCGSCAARDCVGGDLFSPRFLVSDCRRAALARARVALPRFHAAHEARRPRPPSEVKEAGIPGFYLLTLKASEQASRGHWAIRMTTVIGTGPGLSSRSRQPTYSVAQEMS